MKKVHIRRFDREPIAGFVNQQTFLRPDGVEVMTVDGGVVVVPYADVKCIAFVREFDAGEDVERKLFTTRPKMEGLWVRMRLRDGELLDGIVPNNLLTIEGPGYMVAPPDSNSNNQRLFVPRAALQSMQVMGVVGSPLRARKAKTPSVDQGTLFE